jgi:hypothetical protein
MMGLTQGELAAVILKHLGLPDAIRGPIDEFHSVTTERYSTMPGCKMSQLLQMADAYANGCLLASSAASPLMPLSKSLCRSATGQSDPPGMPLEPIRSEVMSITAMLAQLSAQDERELLAPLVPRRDLRLWLTRAPILSSFDPLHAALSLAAEITVSATLPTEKDLTEHDAVILVSPTAGTLGCSTEQVCRLASETTVRCLSERSERDLPPQILSHPYPLELQQLDVLLESIPRRHSLPEASPKAF